MGYARPCISMNPIRFSITCLFGFLVTTSHSADLVLAENGACAYQIVLPEFGATPGIEAGLRQSARLIQTAFHANGFSVNVVTEGEHEADKPAIYLGDTLFARAQGVDVTKFKDWSYFLKAVSNNVIIAGRDHPGPRETGNSRRPPWDRLGTVKGVVDFLRDHVGVRFLYPDLRPYKSVKAAEAVDLLNSPALEFLPTPKISIPAGLDVRHTPPIAFNTAHPAGGSFYDLANNRFPRVDDTPIGHTWERAIPVDPYRQTHPEYFALRGGKRLMEGNGQYCISNPEVRELFYQDLRLWLERGYRSVGLGQPDGFRACACEPCAKLFNTGDNWGEKIWILHRNLAARVLKEYPDRQVAIMSYILTARPPQTFTNFPTNTKVMLTGTNEEDIAPWRGHNVPGGFTGYVYNWCPNLCTRYTPMRTPGHVATQARRLAANRIQSLYRDGPGALFGLEGPVYYTMGRMFDDPENLTDGELVNEFVDAAFGRTAWHMKRFYDQLYHSITLYSDYLGTRSPAWTYTPSEGRRRKTVKDPFRLLGFLYPPSLLATMESHLANAEKNAKSDKVKTRLALVRREFNYIKSLARVVHLNHAFQIQPDLTSRERLLDAIDARNQEIASWYNKRGRPEPAGNWDYVMFPPPGHNAAHLRLAQNTYQGPFADSLFNWDTKAMRLAPLPGANRLTVKPSTGAIEMNAAAWRTADVHQLTPIGRPTELTAQTSVRALYDRSAIYLKLECDLPAGVMEKLSAPEILSIHLTPPTDREISYRFSVGPAADSKQDAASGFITDAMDPRHGQYDQDWNGSWKYESHLDPTQKRWLALITIPFPTLGVKTPEAAAFWRANIGRVHDLGKDRRELSAWSVMPGTRRFDDRNSFGEWVFAKPSAKSAAISGAPSR
jgi:hypothetical protein